MWYFVTLLTVFLITLIQASFLEAFKYFHFVPNLLLIFFVYLLIYERRERALIFALIIGFITDSLSASTFGLNIVFFIVLALMVNFLRKFVGRSKDLSLAILITVISSLFLILFEIIILLLGHEMNLRFIWLGTKELTWGVLANIIGAAVLIPIFYRVYLFSKKERDLMRYE